MSAILACAVCVTESNGAGRPPAVTIHLGTALCADHLLERTRPRVEIHTTTDPACRLYVPPRTWRERRRFDRARGVSCHACLPKRGPSTPSGISS